MTARYFEPIVGKIYRVLDVTFSKTTVYGYVIALVVTYTIVVVHIPIAVAPGMPHDDGLYMTLGRYLAEGHWLGPYNQMTLMKGPGYPAFLALNNWLGIPLSLSYALFHCFAVTFFVTICRRFIKSDLLSAMLLALLLWHPMSLSQWMLRVFREEIYYGQTLIVLGAMLWVLFGTAEARERNRYAFFAGAMLGWFWLTREEGFWIIPALVVMIIAAVLRTFRGQFNGFFVDGSPIRDKLRVLAGSLLIVVAVFAAIQIGFRSINLRYYGSFVGVDFKESGFQRALGAIHSVRSGGTKPFVSMTESTMGRVAAVSPAFKSLLPYFNGPGKGWQVHGCNRIPETCGEIASGWFMWAFRDAAQFTGHYSSAREASRFYNRIADEISAACARGDLECKWQLIAEMAPVNWPDVMGRLWPRYVDAFKLLILLNPPLGLNISVGGEDILGPALRFLNNPLHTKPADAPALNSYMLSGWYYKSGHEWVSVEVRTSTGTIIDSRFDRRGSPDIQQAFKDPNASDQRFILFTRCSDDCVLRLRNPVGETIERTFSELRKSPLGFDFGKGHVHIDSTYYQPNPEYTLTKFDRNSELIRKAVIVSYSWIFVPILGIALVAFLISSIACWRQVIWNACYIMALVCWGLAFTRTTLLILIHSTTMPALVPFYLAPAYYMMVSAAVLSIAAFFQLFRNNFEPSPSGATS